MGFYGLLPPFFCHGFNKDRPRCIFRIIRYESTIDAVASIRDTVCGGSTNENDALGLVPFRQYAGILELLYDIGRPLMTLTCPDWTRENLQYMINRVQAIIRQSGIDAEERAIAEAQLADFLERLSTLEAN